MPILMNSWFKPNNLALPHGHRVPFQRAPQIKFCSQTCWISLPPIACVRNISESTSTLVGIISRKHHETPLFLKKAWYNDHWVYPQFPQDFLHFYIVRRLTRLGPVPRLGWQLKGHLQVILAMNGHRGSPLAVSRIATGGAVEMVMEMDHQWPSQWRWY